MTKKHFIELADRIRTYNRYASEPFTQTQIGELADFCKHQNVNFNRERWQVEALGSNLARYWTVPVSVILELGSYALVRRGDGLSFIVETRDLEHWPRGH